MDKITLAFSSALAQAKLIREKEISPLELVELYLDRIAQFNSQLGSFYYIALEEAIADAKIKTEQLANIKDITELPPFFGVPTAIKDLNSVAQMPCSYGVQILKNKIATYDDGIVSKIKQAGFIILGKTATSELGSLPYTESYGFPPTRNPWNLDYTPGGSSGGTASAVAAGLLPIAQGSDGGGSVRGPAFCCGLVGLKPSRGRVSWYPVGDYQNGIATNGVIAHTVADAAAFLDIISGYIIGDPYWLLNPEISFLEASKKQPPQLKIAFATSVLSEIKTSAVCQEIVLKTVHNLAKLGHIIEEISLDFSDLIAPFKKVWQAGVVSAGIPLETISPINRWIGQQAGTAGEYLQAVTQMQIQGRKIVALFEQFDILLLPTYIHPPIKIGEWDSFTPEETLDKIISWIAPCPPFNASGNPAIALPVDFTSNGLPIGIQLVGKPAAEAIIISLAAQLEVTQSWKDKPKNLFYK